MSNRIKVCAADPGAILPKLGTSESAGADLCCIEAFALEPGETRVVETGLIMQPPKGYRIDIRSRSGLAAKHGVSVLNSPGTIDRDYCGPDDTIKIILHRSSSSRGVCFFNGGDRVAQMVLTRTNSWNWDVKLDPNFVKTENRTGLGSTGISSEDHKSVGRTGSWHR